MGMSAVESGVDAESYCQHLVRRRDENCGFPSQETICVACGQVFDPEREEELRERDRANGAVGSRPPT
jgi:hypothetical protein